jgi:hypothetical protein
VGAAHPEDLGPLPRQTRNRGKGLTRERPKEDEKPLERSGLPRGPKGTNAARGRCDEATHMCHSPPRQSAELGRGINVSVVAGGLANGLRLALVVAARPVCRETRRASSGQRTLKVAWPSSCP